MNQIPVVDKDTATRLGSRKLGEMTELVSQFEIENNYTQINYNGIPYRVTPLSYADPIKWLYNQKKGLPAYITVNMVTQQTDLVWLENGMKYSPSEYFFRNIYRHIRFLYPTKMFEEVSFEIDDEGTPYWVAPTIQYPHRLVERKGHRRSHPCECRYRRGQLLREGPGSPVDRPAL